MVKNKDPNAPKKNLTGYFLYTQSVRPTMSKDPKYADVKGLNVQLMKDMSEKWNALPSGEQDEWKRKGEADKIRYQAELKKYKEDHPEELAAHVAKQKAARAKKRDLMTKGKGSQIYKKSLKALDGKHGVPPCRVNSGYMNFSNEVRPTVVKENPTVKMTGLGAFISKAWADLPQSKRDQMNNDADVAREKMRKIRDAWEKTEQCTQYKADAAKLKAEFLEGKKKKAKSPKKKKKKKTKKTKKKKATKGATKSKKKSAKESDDEEESEEEDDDDSSEGKPKAKPKSPVKKDIVKKEKKDKKDKKEKKKKKKDKKEKKKKKKEKKKKDDSDSDSD